MSFLTDHKCHTSLLLTGRNADVDTGTEEIVPVARGTLPAVATGYVASIVSSSTDDDGAPVGTGARTVLIEGVGPGTGYAELSEVVTLNGTGAVVTVALFTRINRVTVLTAGSTGSNVGTLTTSLNSQSQDVVPATANQSQSLAWAVPANQRLVLGLLSVSTSLDAAAARVLLRVREYSPVSAAAPYRSHELGYLPAIAGGALVVDLGGLVIPAKHEVSIQFATTTDNTIVVGSLQAALGTGPG